MGSREDTWIHTNHGEANQVLGRTVWSTPQLDKKRGGRASCSSCQYFADTDTRVSALTKDYDTSMTFGFCQNLKIWAAFGKEKPPITRSYHYCNYHKEKENGKRR